MTETEKRAIMVPLLKVTALATRIQQKLVIGDRIGWPADVEGDLAEGRRLLRHARVEIGVVEAKRRFEARWP